MNDIAMGFKHTMLQRLHNFDVSPAKSSSMPNSPASSDEQSPYPAHVTDFSINRILSDGSNKRRTLPTSPETITTTATTATNTPKIVPPMCTSPSAADILDLSKSSLETTASPRLNYPTPGYPAFQTDFLAAAAAANATKFYAQFFPHMFPSYVASTFGLPNSPYPKRYFAPYIINSHTNHATLRLTPPTNVANPVAPTAPTTARSKNLCPRINCSDCLDYYKQFPYKPPPPPPALPPTNQINYLKAKSATELLLKSSTLSMTAVTNINLTSKSARLSANNATTATASSLEEISYKCYICDKVFGCSQTLQAHEKTHKSPRYECTDCGKGFSQLRNYKYHLSVHRGTKEFAAECPECGKTFNDKGYLSSHMKIHRNKKEYECPYCPKSFNQRVAFNMHVRIHTGVKPHKCVECGKRFSRKMLLKQHMRTHSGEKPYQCSVCGKSFADRSNMTLHHRLHSGIKPFNCPICPKAFTKKHHLKTHLNYHTGCKPYVCPHLNCNQAFTQSSNMRTHAKKCQYRPLQLSFPAAGSSVHMSPTLATNAATTSAASSHCANISVSAPTRLHITSTTAATAHLPVPNALSAGIRMLSAAQTTPAFPPAQQPLLSTLRPF